MNQQQHQQLPSTLVDVLSVSDLEDNEMVRNHGVDAAVMVQAVQCDGPAVMVVPRAARQPLERPSTVVSNAIASCYDDEAAYRDA